MYKQLFWLLIIVMFSASCTLGIEPTDQAVSTIEVKITADQTQPGSETYSPYPYPEIQPTVPIVEDTYPEPESQSVIVVESIPTPTPIIIPTPSEGLSIVTGLLLIDGEESRPYISVLYLGSTLKSSDPSFPPMIALSESDDPQAMQDPLTGRFLFTDVKPGTYALVIWTPASSFPILDETGQHLLIEVQAGEVKDLGVIPIN